MRGRPGYLYFVSFFLGKHPRVCGEDVLAYATKKTTKETPPRMRGRLLTAASAEQVRRNTPAYAGKTPQRPPRRSRGEKNHRVCGEDSGLPLRRLRERETPPRMRGRRKSAMSSTTSARNTPAYAGKTNRKLHRCQCTAKHPRVCGEDSLFQNLFQGIEETPPRMRGRLHRQKSLSA